MNLLLDTHLLIWLAAAPEKLSPKAVETLTSLEHEFFFSVVSIWEVAIKTGRKRRDFDLDPSELRESLLSRGWDKLALRGEHTLLVPGLPFFHKDPFDRALIAQAQSEGLTLMTVDRIVTQYPAATLYAG